MASISIVIKFTVLEVLLGYIHYDESLFHCVNYIVLMGKHFVSASRDGKNPLSFFLAFLKSKLKIEQETFTSKQLESVFNKRFGYIFLYECANNYVLCFVYVTKMNKKTFSFVMFISKWIWIG